MTPDRVAELLDGLGDTADAVAATLRAHGVRGIPAHQSECPIANLLRGKGCGNPLVNDDDVLFYDDERYWHSVDTPEPVAAFINGFDEGDYPALIEDEDDEA